MTYRVLIYVGTLFFLGAIFLLLVFIPKTGEISRIRKEIATIEQRIKQGKIRTKNLVGLEAEQVELNAQFRQALKLLPDQMEIPSLLRSITQMGSDSNLQFRLFSPEKERPRDFYIEIPFSVEVSGKYHDLALFFDKVGQMERIVNILDISMKPVKELSTNLITICDAVTYCFKGKTNDKTKKR